MKTPDSKPWPPKILLLGKNGQVGWELQRALAPLGEVIALGRTCQDGMLSGDLNDLASLQQTVRAVRPHVIINAAAYTAVDQAEHDIEHAHTINAMAPTLLAEEARDLGATLIHYSTDYVFNGTGTHAWQETDVAHPLNVYGHTKLVGEQGIQTSNCHYYIFRTSWVYSRRGANFAKTILRLAQERDHLSVIDDQIGAPTSAELIADITAKAVYGLRQQPECANIYHLTADGETSWHGYATFVLQKAAEAGIKLNVQAHEITPVPSTAYPVTAQRPLNSRLDTASLRRSFHLTLPTWQHGVARMLTEILTPMT